MDLTTFSISECNRFFKLSELAGKRWPNVTKNEIYNWHDKGFYPPTGPGLGKFKDVIKEFWPDTEVPESVMAAIDDCWFELGKLSSGIDAVKKAWPEAVVPESTIRILKETWDNFPDLPNDYADAIRDFWEDNSNSMADINLFSFWVFIPEFRSLLTGKEISLMPEYKKRQYELSPYELLINSYFRVDTDSAKGFAFNEEEKVNCLVVYDEKGAPHVSAEFKTGLSKFFPGSVGIKKENLLIKASSVRLLEKITPEITSKGFRNNHKEVFKMPENPKGSRPLTGWKEIAAYIGCSVSTVKRHYKKAVWKTDTRTIMSTTYEIDKAKLARANRKK